MYSDYAELFTYHGQSKEWELRKRGVDTVVGRMYFIMPHAGELYFLGLFFNHVPGATSFVYLRTVEGTEYVTYQQVSIRRGLLQVDDEWQTCLMEAVGHCSAARLRLLFCTILEYNLPKDPYKLWLTFEDDFIGDLMYHAKQKLGKHRLRNRKDVVNDALTAFERMLQRQGLSLTKFPSTPLPVFSKTGREPAKDNDTWTVEESQQTVRERVPTLTSRRGGIFDEVTTSTTPNTFDAKCFFIENSEAVENPTSTTFCLPLPVAKGTMPLPLLQAGLHPHSWTMVQPATLHLAFP